MALYLWRENIGLRLCCNLRPNIGPTLKRPEERTTPIIMRGDNRGEGGGANDGTVGPLFWVKVSIEGKQLTKKKKNIY